MSEKRTFDEMVMDDDVYPGDEDEDGLDQDTKNEEDDGNSDNSDWNSADDAGDWSDDAEDDDSNEIVEDLEMQRIRIKRMWLQKAKQTRERILQVQKENPFLEDLETINTSDRSRKDKMERQEKFFKPEGVMEILIKQLFNFKENLAKDHSYPFAVTCVDDDIYHWNVKIRQFPADSKIANDLFMLSSKYDLSDEFVEVRVRFHADIYPFYPPSIRLIRPRLENMMFCSIVCMDDIQLRNWNPVRRLEDILLSIRKMIIKNGAIDPDNPVNDPSKIAEPFTETEFQLAKLSLLTQIPFRSNLYSGLKGDGLKPVNISDISPPKVESQQTSHKPKGRKAWAAGVGYGHAGDASQWDVEAWQKAQRRKDAEVSEILNLVIKDLEQTTLTNYNAELMSDSCLVPFFRKYLDNDSIIDISRHGYLYTQLLTILQQMARHRNMAHLFLDKVSENNATVKSIFEVLKGLNQKAQITLRLSKQGPEKSSSGLREVLPPPGQKPYLYLGRKSHQKMAKHLQYNENKEAGVDISEKIADTYKVVKAALASMDFETKAKEEEKKSDLPSSSLCGFFNSSSSKKLNYVTYMSPHAFGTCKDFGRHHYLNDRTVPEPYGKRLLKRLAIEFADLPSSLPIYEDSSVFMRILERNTGYAQMIIIPSDGTPYASGCFLFDVYFPSNYPSVPPKVNLQTTGRGTVRFNPNLYKSGKVCLSLLGTWRGENQGEQWNPSVNIFLQVAVSIQSLIFVAKPYFNEPGYEQHMGTTQGEAKSKEYNVSRQLGTVKFAMVDMLKNPPKCWAEVIETHFYIQQDRVIKNAVNWLGPKHALVKELRRRIAALPRPKLRKFLDDDD